MAMSDLKMVYPPVKSFVDIKNNDETHIEMSNDSQDGSDGVLLLVFTKSPGFKTRAYHTDIELVLVNSPAPTRPAPGRVGVDTPFASPALLVYIDRIKGVMHSTDNCQRFRSISATRNSILSIPLDAKEFKNVIEFMYAVQGLRFNHFDALLAATASLIFPSSVTDIAINPALPTRDSIKSLHAPQLTALIIRHCITNSCKTTARLWGFNSRLVSANELFERLRTTCVPLDADRLSAGMLQSSSEGMTRE
jgi:hypothetical protein